MEITWRANYHNGNYLNQYNEDGSVNKYTDIDRSLLESFELRKVDGNSNILFFKLLLEKGQRLIFRRRVQVDVSGNTVSTMYLVGWQKNIKGENIQAISYVFEDGHVVMAGQWKDDTRLFYAPNLIEEEK